MFAAGVMVSIVCFGLVPEAIEMAGMTASIIGLIVGVVVIMLLNRLVDKISKTHDDDKALI